MIASLHRVSLIAALAMIVTVATQLLYVASGPLGFVPDRDIVWGLEVIAALTAMIFGGMQFSLGGTGLLFPAIGAGTAATLFLALILTASTDRAGTPLPPEA